MYVCVMLLCSPSAYLPVASKQNAGIENSYLAVICFMLDINGDSIARGKRLFESLVK